MAQRQNVNLVNQQSQVETQDASSVVDMLSHLNVGGISRVEINSRTDARYGSLGAYGVISIYTKKVQNKRESEKTMDFFAITGYQKPERFSVAVNFSATDQQNYFPTIYWNPDFVIRTTAPNRIALPRVSGSEIYRVTIAGVTKAGVPVFGEFLIYPNKEKPLRASLDQRQK